jgi:hypothetical protein
MFQELSSRNQCGRSLEGKEEKDRKGGEKGRVGTTVF